MDLDEFEKLLLVPNYTRHEQPMVKHLLSLCSAIPGVTVARDFADNVYVAKGTGTEPFTCVSAHLDSVQSNVAHRVVREGDKWRGVTAANHNIGLGADCKTGVQVCLELLRSCPRIAVCFFAGEESGMIGAGAADADFFKYVNCVIEFDAPSRGLVSYTSGGARLFQNYSPFMDAVFPILEKHKSLQWQDHPYSDVLMLRRRFEIPCLNLSSGYYNWHMPSEFIRISDVEAAIALGKDLVAALDGKAYKCPKNLADDVPRTKVTGLIVPKG